MLSDHLRQNGVFQDQMNDIQRDALMQITTKIADGQYQFETPLCPTCLQQDFEPLANKERYGVDYSLAACRSCGLYQVSPRLDANALKDFYANHYRNLYHGKIEAASAHSIAAQDRGRIALDLLSDAQPLLPDARVIEIGCAAGSQIIPFKTAGCSVGGYDYDDQIIAMGRQEHGIDLHFGGIEAFTNDVKAGARRADAILYIHVFEHLSDIRNELCRIEEGLASHGLLYLEVPGLTRALRTREVFFDAYFEIAHTYHFDRETLTALIHACGWECLYVDNYVRAVIAPPKYKTNYSARAQETITSSEKARVLEQNPDTDPSILLTAYLRGGATHAQAYFRVGEWLFQHKDSLCVSYLSTASELAPDRGKFIFLLARAMMTYPGTSPAVLLQTLETSVRLLPGSPYPLFHLGRSLFAAQRFEEALGAYTAAIRLKSDVAFFYYWQGLAFKALSNTPKAVSSFETACAGDEKMVFAYYELGLALLALNRKREAADALSKACILKPDDPRFTQALETAQTSV